MVINSEPAVPAKSPTEAPSASRAVRVRVTLSPAAYEAASSVAVTVAASAAPTFTVAVVLISPDAVSLIVRTTAPNLPATPVTSTTAVPAATSAAVDVASTNEPIVAVVPDVTVIPTDGTTTLFASYAITSSAPVVVAPARTFFLTVALRDATAP